MIRFAALVILGTAWLDERRARRAAESRATAYGLRSMEQAGLRGADALARALSAAPKTMPLGVEFGPTWLRPHRVWAEVAPGVQAAHFGDHAVRVAVRRTPESPRP